MPDDATTATPTLRLDGQGIPLWVSLELTYRCPLQCVWCNNPLDFGDYARKELSTAEWSRVLREARELGAVQLGFTGGEPLLREDLEVLVAEADRLGFYTNLITSGFGLTESRMAALRGAGLRQVQLSLQASQAALTDALVGTAAHARKLDAARLIKAQGLPMVLNVPLVRQNIHEVEAMLEFAAGLGVEYVEFANIQYYNWALLNRDELLPTREQLLAAEQTIARWRERLAGRMTIYFVIPDYFEGRPKACMNGWGTIHLTIAPDGVALPCQEARILPGIEFPSVRERSLAWLWHASPLFQKFRGVGWLPEPCQSCEERDTDFGGCRCQALLLTGNAANVDPACAKSPQHGVVRDAVARAAQPVRVRQPLIRRALQTMSTAFLDS